MAYSLWSAVCGLWSISLIAAPPTGYTNKPIVTIPLEVSDIGPAGIKEIELYLTRDRGITWRKVKTLPYGEPANLQFETSDGEGLYGFFAAVVDGVGHRTDEPKTGTPPIYDAWVDTTPPRLKIVEPQGGEHWFGEDRCRLSWQAEDEHLPEKSVTIHITTDGGKEWKVLEEKLDNSGTHFWPVPDLDSTEVYLKWEVKDLAGNLTAWTLPLPMTIRRKSRSLAAAASPSAATNQPHPTASHQTASDEAVLAYGEEDHQQAVIACSEGTAHRANGDFDKAEQCLTRALRLWPRYWEAMNDLGVLYYQQQKYEKALEQFKSAFALREDGDLHLNLALTYRALGGTDMAISHFRTALADLKESPEAGSILWELARLEWERRNLSEATKYWEKIVLISDPTWSEQAAALLKKYRNKASE